MNAVPVILIFDAGKTNKKILLFDQNYRVVCEESLSLPETSDEDGFACEDVELLTRWITSSLARMITNPKFAIQAINFSAYGASLVFVDEFLRPVLPLYNYLKPYPREIAAEFYNRYGDANEIALETSSPPLGNLNSGLQLYRVKHQQQEIFGRIRFALHLPQFISSVLTRIPSSDITSIGCHTCLWDFSKHQYHRWVKDEGLADKLAPIRSSREFTSVAFGQHQIKVGGGLHDSSAALIPYLRSNRAPFILISTGTWCISLNPFTTRPLTGAELENDCLCYLTHEGTAVKASRLFSGHEHEHHVKALAKHYEADPEYFSTLVFDAQTATGVKNSNRDYILHTTAEEAYYALMITLVDQQRRSTDLVMEDDIADIFVEGGFSRNSIYLNLLAQAYPKVRVYAASMSQGSALGAALALHDAWNDQPVSGDLVQLNLVKGA